jgi:hypothetical protein
LINAPPGSYVSGWWSVYGNTSATFFVVEGSIGGPYTLVVEENGTSGSFTFTVDNPPCRLVSTEPGEVSGTIWYPIL